MFMLYNYVYMLLTFILYVFILLYNYVHVVVYVHVVYVHAVQCTYYVNVKHATDSLPSFIQAAYADLLKFEDHTTAVSIPLNTSLPRTISVYSTNPGSAVLFGFQKLMNFFHSQF